MKLISFIDYAQTAFSILLAALKTLQAVVVTVLPYMILIAAFASFVVWNGGVVLGIFSINECSIRSNLSAGDKSNHVATLHLPQMLYIWPYMLFFSFPIAVPSLLSAMLSNDPSWGRAISQLPRWWIVLGMSTVAALVVHYNTIVHPFTLADNRHYVFYTFRILMRHWSIKYLVTPIYIVSGWLVIRTLGSSTEADLPAKTVEGAKIDFKASVRRLRPSFSDGCNASFALVWLLTTALSLITAPLVEPRYFIIPWVVWRLFVPIAKSRESANPKIGLKMGPQPLNWFAKGIFLRPEAWLWMETIWFCLINCVTGYIFLNRTFEWSQEPGKLQRFMW